MATLMGIETEYGFTALDAAGNRLDAAAGELLQAMRDLLQRCNVDYGGMQTTWRCRESYLYKCMSHAEMAPQLLNSRRRALALRALPKWRVARAVSLDVLWPE